MAMALGSQRSRCRATHRHLVLVGCWKRRRRSAWHRYRSSFDAFSLFQRILGLSFQGLYESVL